MDRKILIPLYNKEVAPRFDLASEALIVSMDKKKKSRERTVMLPQASAEKLCHLILIENIQVVICGGIEDEYYQYLTWKKVTVLDSVIGPYEVVLERFASGLLQPGDIDPGNAT
ncbi:MAG: dinitrogenase iron-molybdenum cofactor biosynthesis protein [Deltaproteobacteria bacterium]|nr:dinitrogenase iron-molybdenum cofactor biosynthesis protein [Deltaproteobacteria bacterium]